jgi:hypothetical protein
MAGKQGGKKKTVLRTQVNPLDEFSAGAVAGKRNK